VLPVEDQEPESAAKLKSITGTDLMNGIGRLNQTLGTGAVVTFGVFVEAMLNVLL
jgi:hypothetical protein